jgi:hypothetical protein
MNGVIRLPRGAGPSALLVALLIRGGYWPEEAPPGSFAAFLERVKGSVAKPAKQGFLARAWGKVKGLFGK